MNNAEELNIYIPKEAEILSVADLTKDVKLFTVRPDNSVNFNPGQFFMVSVFGAGEVPISIASAMTEPLMFCIRNVGKVTSAIHGLKPGDKIGLRGPYGNGFSFASAKARDAVIIAGGLGIAPLRPLIREFIENSNDYKKVFLIYGSRTPSDIIYRHEVSHWEAGGIKVFQTVDCGDEQWSGCTGLVTDYLGKIDIDFTQAVSFVCGPEIMIENSMRAVLGLGMPSDRIITTLESHMKCGVGKCGHCYKASKYVCTDGPVFTYKELNLLSERFIKEPSPHTDPMWGY